MAAVFGFEESDIRIRKDFLPSLGKDANKGVIGRVQNEGGHGDAIYNIRCRGSGIVINCAGKTAIVSGNLVIKFAKSGNAAEARSLINLREKSSRGDDTLGTAAIALIHAYHVHSCGQALFRHA